MIPEGINEYEYECEAIDAHLSNAQKMFKCPMCKRVREFEDCVMKVCQCCQVEMEVVEL